MAKTISEEELQLRKRARRRLIGAIALVAIVAIFVPMVLDHEPKPSNQDITIQIPSSDSGGVTSKIVPRSPGEPKSAAKSAPASAKPSLKAEREISSASAASKPPAYDTEAAPPKSAAESAKTQTKQAPKPGARDTPVAAPIEPKSEFVVQVAALNDAAKAKQMQEQIAAQGITAYTEVVPTSKGTVTRVRAGPFGSRDEAERMRDKLKALGLAGNVVPRRS